VEVGTQGVALRPTWPVDLLGGGTLTVNATVNVGDLEVRR